MKNIIDFKNFILNEDGEGSSCGSGDAGGTAMASLNSINGMGVITAPQAGSPGNVWGITTGDGSTTGSGDVPAYDFGTSFQQWKKKKRKNKVKVFTKIEDYIKNK